MPWQLSRYNGLIALEDGGALYNRRTGALLRLSSAPYNAVARATERGEDGFSLIPGGLTPHLVAGGFAVSTDLDEVADLEARYESRRRDSAFLLTISPTFRCNLSCGYCFVGSRAGSMSEDTQANLISATERFIARGSHASMSVDWFGGEPLLNLRVIRSLSAAFMRICSGRGIPYSAQVITNGTRIDEATVSALIEAGVDRLQVTLDGPASVHDARRPIANGKPGRSSFRAVLDGLGHLVGRFLIRLRINVDVRNQAAVWELLDLLHARRWLGPTTRVFPYLARVTPFTEACGAAADVAISLETFHALQLRWITRLHSLGVPVVAQGLYGFPEPKLYCCGAVGSNGFVITPAGEVHKCGLTADDSREALAVVGDGLCGANAAEGSWMRYSPFRDATCRECAFLPSCLGGCPRNQMLDRQREKEENCRYYRYLEGDFLRLHIQLSSAATL